MNNKFNDIKITKFDSETTKAHNKGGSLVNAHFILSDIPSDGWIFHFQSAWQSILDSNHKRVIFSSQYLVIEKCDINILDQYKEKLTNSIDKANANYKNALDDIEKKRAKESEDKKANEKAIDDMAKKLKF